MCSNRLISVHHAACFNWKILEVKLGYSLILRLMLQDWVRSCRLLMFASGVPGVRESNVEARSWIRCDTLDTLKT